MTGFIPFHHLMRIYHLLQLSKHSLACHSNNLTADPLCKPGTHEPNTGYSIPD